MAMRKPMGMSMGRLKGWACVELFSGDGRGLWVAFSDGVLFPVGRSALCFFNE